MLQMMDLMDEMPAGRYAAAAADGGGTAIRVFATRFASFQIEVHHIGVNIVFAATLSAPSTILIDYKIDEKWYREHAAIITTTTTAKNTNKTTRIFLPARNMSHLTSDIFADIFAKCQCCRQV